MTAARNDAVNFHRVIKQNDVRTIRIIIVSKSLRGRLAAGQGVGMVRLLAATGFVRIHACLCSSWSEVVLSIQGLQRASAGFSAALVRCSALQNTPHSALFNKLAIHTVLVTLTLFMHNPCVVSQVSRTLQ